MKTLELIRLETSRGGTFGILKIDKQLFCATLEPPDILNKRNHSSVPAQQYFIQPHYSQRFGKTWIVDNVPDRTAILFHAGNWVDDTQGCILLGESVKKLRGERAVTNSGETFREFLNIMQGQTRAHLTISEVY